MSPQIDGRSSGNPHIQSRTPLNQGFEGGSMHRTSTGISHHVENMGQSQHLF